MSIRRAIVFVAIFFLAGPATHAECLLSCWTTPTVESESTCHKTRPDGPMIGAADDCPQPAVYIAPFVKTSPRAEQIVPVRASVPVARDAAVRRDIAVLPPAIRPPILQSSAPLRI